MSREHRLRWWWVAKSGARSGWVRATVAGLTGPGLDAIWSQGPLAAIGLVALLGALGWLVGSAVHGPDPLPGWERAAWSAALGATTVVFAGLVLALTPFGLSHASWLVALSMSTVAASVGAWCRHPSARPALDVRVGSAPDPPGGAKTAARVRRFTASQSALLVLAVALAGGGLWLSVASAASVAGRPAFTQLWLTGVSPQLHRGQALLGVANHEHATTSYRLVLRRDGVVDRSWALSLRPGQTWQMRLADPPGSSLVASLYRASAPGQVYRQVDLVPAQ